MKQFSNSVLIDHTLGLESVKPDAGDTGLKNNSSKIYDYNIIDRPKSQELSTIPHEIANGFLMSGLSVIPCDPKTKKPTIKWKGFQSNLIPDAKALKWPGFAIICGEVSGNLECLDFDFKASWFDEWRAVVEREDSALLSALLTKLLIQQTQSGGLHCVYRCTDTIPGNQKLATDVIQIDPSETYEKSGKLFFTFHGKELEVQEVGGKLFVFPCFIETRGAGGYFLAAPTQGYSAKQGTFSSLPVLSASERASLINSARALNRKPPEPERIVYKSGNGDRRPGDIYNEQTEILPLLERHGWKLAGSNGNVDHLTRPGKDRGISASLFNGKILHVFSSNASPFESVKSYSPFSVYVLLEHSGDYSAAAAALLDIEKSNNSNDLQTKDKAKKETQAQIILRLIGNIPLYLADDKIYSNIPINNHFEFLKINSGLFKSWLSKKFHNETGAVPSRDAIQGVLRVLGGKALGAPEAETAVRVGGDNETIIIDLCNKDREVVVITRDGWDIRQNSSVFFRRQKGNLPLIKPKKGGSIDDLKPFLNLKDENSWIMVVAFLVQSLRPFGPYPILSINGEQGTAKSTMSRLLRSLVDPNAAPLRTSPSSERDLAISCNNSWLQVFENISFMPDWLSDALCRISTGGGFAIRAMYEDDEEALFSSQRPMVLNGITNFINRHDLGDRALIVDLEPIPENKRIPESELMAKFEKAAPYILGALMDAVSTGLKNIKSTKLDSYPRMADFALWISASEAGLPWKPGDFVKSYDKKRAELVENAIENSPVGNAIAKLMEDKDSWDGTATELLSELENIVGEKGTKNKSWPKDAARIGKRLRENSSFLRKVGIEISPYQTNKKRGFKIIKSGTDKPAQDLKNFTIF